MRLWQGRTQDDDLTAAWQELALQAAKNKPWLLKLLSERRSVLGGTALAARYAVWKGRLERLGQGERRRLQRRLGVGLAGAALLLALAGGPAGASPANTITVSGACDLIEAIHNANDTTTGQPYTDCAAGDPAGADSIYLTGAVTLTAPNNVTYGPTGLPVVTSEITIEGNGNTIARSGATVDFRILAVGSGGNLTLNSATVSGGITSGTVSPANVGGGIFAKSATLVVLNSTLSGNTADNVGGGIYVRSVTVSVSNSTLSGNSAGSSGGGIWASFATLAVTNSTLSGNTAGLNGGGINAQSATLAVSNSTLSGNTAGHGGGINAFSATVTVSNSTLSGNTASWGGGIYAGSATVAVSNSTLSGNTASDDGGGIYARSATVTVTNSTLSGNTASYGGGGIRARSATVTVTNSTLSGNTARYGGGLYAGSATVTVTNSTLSGNSAGNRGGGIYARYGTVTVTNSTLSGNSAGSSGGGIYAYFSATVEVSRSLVSGNTAATGNEVFNNDSTVTAASYNLFGHDGETDAQAFYNFTPGATDINATSSGTPYGLAAILDTTLADNDSTVLGGVPPGSIVQTLALPAGSPAIDAAPSAACVAPILDFDQRGKPRNVDGNGFGSFGMECDIGAFELQTESVPRIIVHKQTRPDGDTTPFQFKLRGPASRNFSLADNQPHSTGLLPAGIYTLEEVLPPGWDPAIPLSSLTCDDGSPLAAIDLAADEVLVCRFLNYKRGNIIVKKVAIPAAAAPSFSMRLIDNSTNAKTLFSLANAQQFDSGAISSVPTYKLLETVPGGWRKKNIVCDNGSPSTAIAVPPGGSVECTVTNENTAPSNILLSNSLVAENKAIGTVVGNLSAADAAAGDTHTFSFVNDGTPAAANNGNFQIVGKQLKTAKKFDFEQKSSHTIKLQVTDSAGQTRVKAFVISVVDGPG